MASCLHFIKRHPILLGSLALLGAAGVYIAQVPNAQVRRSTAIGKAVGEEMAKQQRQRDELNALTKAASASRQEYTPLCYFVATEVYRNADNPNYSPQDCITHALSALKEKFPDNPQTAVICEDMAQISNHFIGTNKDLKNMMCFYHCSPEVKFLNRYSETFEINHAIDCYHAKSRRFLFEKYNIEIKGQISR